MKVNGKEDDDFILQNTTLPFLHAVKAKSFYFSHFCIAFDTSVNQGTEENDILELMGYAWLALVCQQILVSATVAHNTDIHLIMMQENIWRCPI